MNRSLLEIMYSESGSFKRFAGVFQDSEKENIVAPEGYLKKSIDQRDITSQKNKQILAALQTQGPETQTERRQTVNLGFKNMVKRAEAVSKIVDQLGGESEISTLQQPNVEEPEHVVMAVEKVPKPRRKRKVASVAKRIISEAVGSSGSVRKKAKQTKRKVKKVAKRSVQKTKKRSKKGKWV